MTVYILHQGANGNAYYTLFHKPPRVTKRMVRSEATGDETPLFESPDPFVFNFCLFGFERWLKVKLPLGSCAQMTLTLEHVTDYAE